MVLCARAYVDIRENVYDERFGNGFVRTTYWAHVAELWCVCVFGSTLIFPMLKRQAFPLRFRSRQTLKTNPEDSTVALHPKCQVKLLDVDGGGGHHTEQPDAKLRHQRTFSTSLRLKPPGSALSSTFDSSAALSSEWPSPFRSGDSAASRCPSTFDSGSARQMLDTEPSNDGRLFPLAPLSQPAAATEEEDVSWYAGYAGRSIVLQALASGSTSDMGAKAAWRTNYTNNASNDVERAASLARMFATPHGIISTDVPLREVTFSPPTPRSPSSVKKRFSLHPDSR